MSDIRYNGWLHRSGTGGVWQDSSGRVGIGTSVGMNCLINSGPNALTFGTGTTPAERARIDSDGNLIVGATAADSFKFKVLNGAGLLGRFTDGTSQTLDIRQATGGIELQNPNNGFIAIKGTSERARFNSSGQVLVNSTTDPYDSRSLTVGLVPGQSNNYISIIGATNGVSGLTFGDALGEAAGNYAGMFEYYHSGDYLTYKQNGSEKLRIDSSGRLLIGTTTEGHVSADDLTIAGSGDVGITIRSGASSEGSIMFSDGTSGGDEYRGWINYNQNSNFLRFFTDATERLRIDQNGDVLIGHTSSTTVTGEGLSLQVQGSGGYTGASLIRTSAAGAQLQFAAGSSGNNTANNTGLGYIKFFGYHTNGYDEYARIHAEVEGTPGDGDAPGAIVFSTSADGSSTVTEEVRILPSGGITFNGDTAAANALDDYEEGSWTPAPDDLSNTPQYHNKVGIYTKIGNLVYVMGFIQFGSSPKPTFSNTANQLYVSGLPFPCNAGAGYVGAVGHVTYQSMNWSGGTYNDYGADVKLVCTATSSSKVQFRVDGGNNTIRGTLRKAAWHDKDFIVTWSMWYRTTS